MEEVLTVRLTVSEKASTVINLLFSFHSYKFYLNQILQIGVIDTDLR